MKKTRIYECRIPHIIYGYSIEKSEDGLFYLTYEKWNEGKSWNMLFPPFWGEYRLDTAVHIYQNVDDAKRAGNNFLIDKAAYKTIEMESCKIVWYWIEDESNAAKSPFNNLMIYDDRDNEIWNINNFFHADEMCTGLRKISDHTFYFTTFMCEGITMKITEQEISCINKVLTR